MLNKASSHLANRLKARKTTKLESLLDLTSGHRESHYIATDPETHQPTTTIAAFLQKGNLPILSPEQL